MMAQLKDNTNATVALAFALPQTYAIISGHVKSLPFLYNMGALMEFDGLAKFDGLMNLSMHKRSWKFMYIINTRI